MAFTYDLTMDAGKLRLEIGDSTEGTGVRPDGTNFEDDEIAYILDQEGGSLGRAVARACEMLATLWASAADLTVGPRSESLSQVATRYESRAKALRLQYGGAITGAMAVGVIRADGYQSTTEPEQSDDYDATGGDVRAEYMGTTIYVLAG